MAALLTLAALQLGSISCKHNAW